MIRYGLALALLVPLGTSYHPQYVPSAHFPTVAPLNPCTVSAWPMNEGSGLTFFDHGPAANNATIGAGSNWGTQSGFPGSVRLAYVATAASSTPTTSLFTGNAPFTVALWTNATAQPSDQVWFDTTNLLTAPGLFIRAGGSGDGKFAVVLTSGAFPTGGGFVQSTWIPDGSVQYLAVVYNGTSPAASNFIMYKNGVAQTSNILTNNLSSTVTSTTAAKLSSGPGTVAYMEIYNCALSAATLAANFAAGPGLY